MGYRDPATHREQLLLRNAANEREFERVALAKYGAPYDDLPWVLRHAVDAEVYQWPAERWTGRRFDNVADRTRKWLGWRTVRTYREQRIEEERQATVVVRQRRSKRKVRARRFSGRRPEMPPDGEAEVTQ